MALLGALSLLSIEYQSVLGISGRFGKVKAVERGIDHPTPLRTLSQENVDRYLHILHAPFTARAYRTGDSFTFLPPLATPPCTQPAAPTLRNPDLIDRYYGEVQEPFEMQTW